MAQEKQLTEHQNEQQRIKTILESAYTEAEKLDNSITKNEFSENSDKLEDKEIQENVTITKNNFLNPRK